MLSNTSADLVGAFIGLLLTLCIFSYWLGDNAFFRFAVHLFIGVASGLAAAVVIRNVILPHILLPLLNFPGEAGWLWALLPFLLGLLLLTKFLPGWRMLGDIPMAYVVGVGAAAIIGGAVVGTLFPQVNASAALMNLNAFPGDAFFGAGFGAFFNRIIALVGTLTALIYFYFGSRTGSSGPLAFLAPLVNNISGVGRIFIAITFGVLFAGVYAAALTALVDRVNFFVLFLEAVSRLF